MKTMKTRISEAIKAGMHRIDEIIRFCGFELQHDEFCAAISKLECDRTIVYRPSKGYIIGTQYDFYASKIELAVEGINKVYKKYQEGVISVEDTRDLIAKELQMARTFYGNMQLFNIPDMEEYMSFGDKLAELEKLDFNPESYETKLYHHVLALSINDLYKLADYINSDSYNQLVVNRLIKANGWTDTSGESCYNVCSDGISKVELDQNTGKAKVV